LLRSFLADLRRSAVRLASIFRVVVAEYGA
jgi:hypothetical protein